MTASSYDRSGALEVLLTVIVFVMLIFLILLLGLIHRHLLCQCLPEITSAATGCGGQLSPVVSSVVLLISVVVCDRVPCPRLPCRSSCSQLQGMHSAFVSVQRGKKHDGRSDASGSARSLSP